VERICVFSGSSPGITPLYASAARRLGQELAARNLGLVYGGTNVGLMGEIANAVLSNDGEVIGVIPKALVEKEVAFTELSDLRVVPSMHQRKVLMMELADGFIALPGGLGTFEEFFEVLMWAQLGMHQKPCGLLSVEGYYSRLIHFLDHAVAEEFIEEEHRSMILVDEDPAGLLSQFADYRPPEADKVEWIKRVNRRRQTGREVHHLKQ
jgi:uncharacterized protein (TIGR00730 family)